jgi:Uma2 family endonuclease
MTTTVGSPEQRVVLHNISWDIYESLLFAHQDRRVPRLTYDRGELEIVSPSSEHEQLADSVVLLVNVVGEELGIGVKGFGSTTFRLEDQERGFEPDGCFYIHNLGLVLGKNRLDLRVDPPPDLVIEIDITSSSLDKFSIMAEAGVPEVWRYDGNGWSILALQEGKYEERDFSVGLPVLSVKLLAFLVEQSRSLEPLTWLRLVRESVRRPAN